LSRLTLPFAGIGFLVLLAVLFLYWRARNPLLFLPQASNPPELVQLESKHRNGRVLQQVALSDPSLGHISFAVSLPDPLPVQKLPLVLVIGGLGTGEHTIRFIADAGDNAIVGYDWPLPSKLPKGIGVRQILALHTRAMSIPGQLSAILRWLAAQSWSDPNRVSILSFSLGAMVAPAAERISAAQGTHIGWTVLAYGGAPIDAVIRGDQRLHPAWVRPLLAFGAESIFRPMDPGEHLQHLDGHFLVLTGGEDTIVSENASARLAQLTPIPKQVIRLPGNHIGTGPEHQMVIDAVIETTRRWLLAEGAINPIPSR
jgi:hypothetical protein